jgi:hypothetical protein
MENYNETPKSFIRWKNTSFHGAISAANRGAKTSVASSPVKYANASTQTATDMKPEQKYSVPAPVDPKSTVLEPTPEPDIFLPIRQPRLPNGPGFAPRPRAAPKILKKSFYTDPKTNSPLSNWEPGALELCIWSIVDPEPSTEELKNADDRKSWKREIDYLNQIKQIRRARKMCATEASKASSGIERHENTYLDQIKQIRRIRMMSAEA